MPKRAAGQEELSEGAARRDDGTATFGPDQLAVPVALVLVLIAVVMPVGRIRSARGDHAAA
jgi:hypothetical protein